MLTSSHRSFVFALWLSVSLLTQTSSCTCADQQPRSDTGHGTLLTSLTVSLRAM